MFSPSIHEGGPAMATRSRRRQRPASSDNSIQQPKAKRQRLPLTEQTFTNPDAAPEMYEVKSNRIAKLPVKPDGVETTAASVPRKELSVRSKKPKPGERISKGDGSVVLTSNNAYTVSKLPALPDRIRADLGSRQHGTIYPSSGYGICVTHTHALVWPYTANSTSPETFTFALPYPSRHLSDPLPLGSLVAPSASLEDPGLVVVMPTTGKITYWESISSAATLDFLRQQRNGVEDSVPGMFSGEHVSQILNAETAGFILVLSSGRLAYMSVRDNQGKPAISVNFLRSSLGTVPGGFFGSIRHALKPSTIRGEVAAVRVGPATKVGERTIAAATCNGRFQTWKIHRGGNHDALVEVDAREEIIAAVKQVDPTIDGLISESFEVLDFTFVPKALEQKYKEMSRLSEAVDDGDEMAQHVVVLVSFPKKRQWPYFLVELVVSPGAAQTGMVRPITSYSNPVNKHAVERPRVLLPRPAVVAYLVFDRALVIASIARPPDTPDSQLQEDSHALPATFEDVIDLRNDSLEIVGSGVEEPQGSSPETESARSHRYKTKNPTAVLVVRGVGLVRVATTDIDRFGSDRPPQVTAKSKLEQAVFFGIKDDNPLAFEGLRAPQFSSKEIGDAALQLSHEILSSRTPFIVNLPASLEHNLRTRTNYLDKLMSHLNALGVDLDRHTRWALLWNAEKMVTATQLWIQHEQFVAERADGKGGEKKSLVSEIVEYIHEDEKKNPNRDIGEVDAVRHFFVNDIWRLEIFIAWAYEVIKYVYKEHLLNDRGITRLLYEAVEINYHALHNACDYRTKKLPFYGLDPADLEGGILVRGYEGLPEPWTSTFFITNNANRLVELCYNWLAQYYPPPADPTGSPDPGLIESIRETLPDLTDSYLVALQEHARWAETRSDPKEQQFGERCARTYLEDRHKKICKLKDYGLWEEAIRVAEKHRSLKAMAEVMVEEVRTRRQESLVRDIAPSRVSELKALANTRERQIGEHFARFGEAFAYAVYDILLRDEGIKAVLDFQFDEQRYVTRYLRSKPELAKISWINDVERERDLNHAADTLLRLGLSQQEQDNIGVPREEQLPVQESQVWNKKIELSLAKLALLAGHKEVDKLDNSLSIIKIQDLIYSWVLPSIDMAVDEAAELVLALESHAGKIPKKQKALIQLFEEGMGRLLKHEALDAATLIDLLTLGTYKERNDAHEEDLYYLALLVAVYGLAREDARQAQRLIWRRCFNRDDWTKINNTALKDDASTVNAVSHTAAYSTMYSLALNRTEKKVKGVFKSVMKPSETLGVYTDELDPRFSGIEDGFRKKLLDSMQWEDSLLRKYIEKSRLDDWYRTVLDAAEGVCKLTLEGENENGEPQAAEVNGNGKSPSPAVNGSSA